MSGQEVKSELHGCVVCGKLYELFFDYDASGRLIDFNVLNKNARPVKLIHRPLVACRSHSEAQVEAAVNKAYGQREDEEE